MKSLPNQSGEKYQIVRLANGAHCVRSLAHGETFHPAIGPEAEAQSLYVNQLSLERRQKNFGAELVVWDVGLGAAANAITLLRAAKKLPCAIRLISFDQTSAALEFALQNAAALGYLDGYEMHLRELIQANHVRFCEDNQMVQWDLHSGDFPSLMAQTSAEKLPKPHAILFDPCSPKSNPEMWTLPLFTRIFQLLDPRRPCVMPTYSRSTMTRAALLLAGFFVGIGHATGQKEETTIAANSISLIAGSLDRKWLNRIRISHSAEPLTESNYRQAPLSVQSWEKLQSHPQFQSAD
ncbi:MAG TPA: MnmC family methyltransferase [Verrucomicrobiae bacterium]|nr:MnmC family methyltransferase [Verrucomicrobiae bacterium]